MRKGLMILALAAFGAIEIPILVWALQVYGWKGALGQFADPVALLILVDFTFFGAAVFLWLIQDARASDRNPWPWLPVFIFSPTLGLLGYLLGSRQPHGKP